MKKKNNTIIDFALTGIGIGIPVTLICMTLIGGFNRVVGEFLAWTVASALFGILSGLILNENNDLSLPVAMTLHCLSCLAVATITAAIIGYANNILDLLLGILPVFVVVYVVVYAVCYFSMKREAQRINEMLGRE